MSDVIQIVVSGPTPVVRIIEVNSPGPQGATGPTGPTGPMGTTDHLLLTNIGTYTHTAIDSHILDTANPHNVTKTQVGLGNVDNTSDANKPVSTAQATAIGVVQSDVNAHEARTDNPHSVTAAQVGADPVGSAAAVASSLSTHVADLANPHAVTKTQVGLGNVDNTSDINKPVSTAQQTALDGKVDENTAITGATKTKITYDSKGLVTAGADATTADVNDSTNRRYVTDAQLTIIGNTSGTNTGDQDLSPYLLIASFVPAGSDKSVLFNDGGGFGGGSAFTFDKATGYLKVPFITYADGTNELLTDAGVLKDAASVLSLDIANRKAFNSTDGTNPTINWEICTLYGVASGVPSVDWTNRRLENSLGYSMEWDYNGGGVRIYMNGSVVIGDFSTQQLLDTNGVKAVEWTNSQRQLFDFGGSYPSVDFGNYWLMNIGISNSVPLLDWSTGAGGSVVIYNGYLASPVANFSAGALYNVGDGSLTQNFSDRLLFDDYGQTSLDWNYHTLQFFGVIKANWEYGILYDSSSVTSAHWEARQLMDINGDTSVDYDGGVLSAATITSIDWASRTLHNSGGSNVAMWNGNSLSIFGTASTTSGAIWTNSTQKNLSVYQDGIQQSLQGVIFTQTATGTSANSTAENTISSTGIGTLTIPSNFFVAGKTLKIKGSGFHSSTASPTLTFKVKFGSTVINTTGAHTHHNATNGYWEFEATITCRTTGASGTVFAQGRFFDATDTVSMGNTATVTVNTTTTQAITCTAQWGTASASNTISLTNLTVEVLN